jgi:hypothetical protein
MHQILEVRTRVLIYICLRLDFGRVRGRQVSNPRWYRQARLVTSWHRGLWWCMRRCKTYASLMGQRCGRSSEDWRVPISDGNRSEFEFSGSLLAADANSSSHPISNTSIISTASILLHTSVKYLLLCSQAHSCSAKTLTVASWSTIFTLFCLMDVTRSYILSEALTHTELCAP